jgi:UDP-N-acetylmuramate--alanine ligase
MRWRELLHLNETNPLPANFLKTPRRVHIIGVGGIGMSGLARLLKARGHHVSGSDAGESPMLAQLRVEGIVCSVPQAPENIGDAEAVFYSSAITESNPEMTAARAAGIPVWHRALLLAELTNSAKVSIAVTGTHGKSTTSAMVAHILTECGLNPTALLGAVYPPFEANVRIGDPDLIVVEADESDGTFSLLKPTVGVVLNAEPEHLENYHESEEELWRAFEMFTANTKQTVLNADCFEPDGRFDLSDWSLFYGLESGYFRAEKIVPKPGKTEFGLALYSTSLYGTYSLPVPGAHNVSNALAAVGAAAVASQDTSGDSYAAKAKTLETFAGTLRRFEKKGETRGVVVYDDYGHHPTEVAATLQAAKEFLHRPIAVIFQPHRYSRTQQLGAQFGPSFEAADKVIITQLYSAFEEPIPGVSGEIVFDAVRARFPEKTVLYACDLDEARHLALELLQPGDALLTMGAGDITKLGPRILKELEARDAS